MHTVIVELRIARGADHRLYLSCTSCVKGFERETKHTCRFHPDTEEEEGYGVTRFMHEMERRALRRLPMTQPFRGIWNTETTVTDSEWSKESIQMKQKLREIILLD